MDSAELYVACIYFKTSNSFSHTPPFKYRIKTGEHPLSLPACAPSSPITYASTCPQVGCWQDKHLWQEGQLGSVDRTPPPPRAGHCQLTKLPSLQKQLTASWSKGKMEPGPAKPSQHTRLSPELLQRWEPGSCCSHPTPSTPPCS